jgi:hypothetical protein
VYFKIELRIAGVTRGRSDDGVVFPDPLLLAASSKSAILMSEIIAADRHLEISFSF